MCGIVGVMNGHEVAGDLIDGLSRLEYRGYDSAGIGTISGQTVNIRRAAGKISNLRSLIAAEPIAGAIGIGHTRWATHGAPVVENAHPHVVNGVGVVHNGIIENHAALRTALEEKGTIFSSDTDSEVLPQLIAAYRADGLSPEAATRAALDLVEGQFAICAIFADEPDLMITARLDSPLEIGAAPGDIRVASDILAFGDCVNETVSLENAEIATLSRRGIQIFNHKGIRQDRSAKPAKNSYITTDKGPHRHFMLKEINEQPDAIRRTLASLQKSSAQGEPPESTALHTAPRMDIVACGTSRYAGNVAKYWANEFAGIDVSVETASEYRYMPRRQGSGPALFISQSGETADTIACLRHVKEHERQTISLVNAASSTMEKEADICLKTEAGPEIGVASTKAFTTQLTSLLALCGRLGQANGTISGAQTKAIDDGLTLLPDAIEVGLLCQKHVEQVALDIADARSVLFLGRGANFPIAMEGALKLKEISYIHAEGFAAGELKHGPIALVDRHTPIVVIAPTDRWFSKSASNMEEVIARGGRVILITDRSGAERMGDKAWHTIILPDVPECIQPIVATVPLQLLAYSVACLKGTDVDQPRNLAKSVTVE